MKKTQTESNNIERKLYNGKHNLVFNEKTHRYKVNDQWVGGVTSMLDRLSKGNGLMQWAANMAVEAMLAGEPAATAKYAHTKKKDDAADIGKRVHSWAEQFIKHSQNGGAKKSFDLPIEDDCRSSIEGFLRWWNGLPASDIETERIVFSETHNYCGTVDLVFNLTLPNGEVLRVVGDFKTGSPEKEYKTGGYTGLVRPYDTHYYQCALYDQAILEEDGKQADAYAVMYLCKDGSMHWFMTKQVVHFRQAALKLVELCQMEKTVKQIHTFDWNESL